MDDIDSVTLTIHEHEDQVLGALFTERESIENILAQCSARDFYRELERKVFECLSARIVAGQG